MHLEDICRLIAERRRLLLWAALLGAIWGLLFTLIQPPLYKIEATFKEGREDSGVELSMRDLFLGGLKSSHEPRALALMQTRHIFRKLLETYGLQAEVSRPLLERFQQHIWGHLRAQCSLPLPDPDWFCFENVRYEGGVSLHYTLRFFDRNHFQVLDATGREVSQGALGKEVQLGKVRWTCSRVPSSLLLNTPFPLRIASRLSVEKQWKRRLTIASSKRCSSLYDLTLYWPDRFLGAELVNGLMRAYQGYLKQNRDEVASEQLVYLETKQASLCKQFEALFDEHAAFLTEQMQGQGWMGLAQEMKSFLEPVEARYAKILAIDLELERLRSEESVESILGAQFGTLFQQQRELAHERSVLLESLPPSELLADRKEPVFLPNASQEIDLNAARSLSLECASKLDAAQNASALYSNLREKLEDAQFDMSALSIVLGDTLSRQLIDSASHLCLQLKETNSSSVRERQRWAEELAIQKASLQEHLAQMEQVEVINAERFRAKLGALQNAVVHGIDRQMAVLQRQVQSATLERARHLQEERKTNVKQMEQLRERAAGLPKRWKQEAWLQLQTEMGTKIMTAMAELVESKTIGRHLHHIESKPLDLAEPPPLPHRSLLLPLLLLGAFAGAFATFWALFLKALYRNNKIALP